jgi:uncharacterized metal-binding protein YceD (DUF177 family)
MPAGPADLIDSIRLAGEQAAVERVYRLADMPRLRDMLADRAGEAAIRFEFFKISDRAAVKIIAKAAPMLVCQRCMGPLEWPIDGNSVVEFARQDEVDGFDPAHELHLTADGWVSLKDLAEEELLLALPFAAACELPESCGKRVAKGRSKALPIEAIKTQRPFADLRDLLKQR